MSSYQPALLVEMIDGEPTSSEIEGEAIILISRNDHGGLEASGTFKSTDERLQNPERIQNMPFQYEGLAFEGNKPYEIRAVVFVKDSGGDLYEIEASTEPVIVQKLDIFGKPVTFPNLLEFDPTDESN